MTSLPPQTEIALAAMRSAELYADAARIHTTKQLHRVSTSRRLTVATGRLLERAGSRLQGRDGA